MPRRRDRSRAKPVNLNVSRKSGTRLSRAEPYLVVALLAVFTAVSWASLERISLTTDEHNHLPAGYSYWKTRDFRLNRQHPPLPKLVGAAPLLFRDLGTEHAWPFFESAPTDTPTGAKEWYFGENLLFIDNALTYDGGVSAARRAMIVFALITALAVFLWSRHLFGVAGGLISLSLCALSPNLIAHARLVTTDAAMAAFYVACPGALYLYWRRPSLRRLGLVGLTLGLGLASKYSSLLLLPVLALMVISALDTGSPRGGAAAWRNPFGAGSIAARLCWVALAAGAVLGIATLVVWASYLFSEPPSAYWKGFSSIYADTAASAPRYFMGEYKSGGWWYYFLATMALKTPLPAVGLLALAGLARLVAPESIDRVAATALAAAPIMLVVGVTLNAEQIGHRYMLGAYPYLFIACGAVGTLPARTELFWRASRWVAASLLILVAASTAHSYPFYLAYHNGLVSGPRDFLRFLDDSNNDWNQGWRELGRLQQRGELGPVAVHVSDDLRRRLYYPGRFVLTGLTNTPPAPGAHAMSAYEWLQYRRRARDIHGPHASLLDLEPTRILAGSVLVWHVPPTSGPSAGRENRPVRTRYANGQLASESATWYGRRHGPARTWNEGGELVAQTEWIDGAELRPEGIRRPQVWP